MNWLCKAWMLTFACFVLAASGTGCGADDDENGPGAVAGAGGTGGDGGDAGTGGMGRDGGSTRRIGSSACDLSTLLEVGEVFEDDPAVISGRADIGDSPQLPDATSCVWHELPAGLKKLALPVYYHYPRGTFEVLMEQLGYRDIAEPIKGIGDEAYLNENGEAILDLLIYAEPLLVMVEYTDDTGQPASRRRDAVIAFGETAFLRAAISAEPTP